MALYFTLKHFIFQEKNTIFNVFIDWMFLSFSAFQNFLFL